MAENCNHNCSSCGKTCGSRTAESMLAPANDKSNVKKVVAVVSGKGGVGKSLVTSMLSVNANRLGKKTAIIDADITGPSIPKTFNLNVKAESDDNYLYPVTTKSGIDVMSINLLVENVETPVIWRGPVIAGAVKQFWSDVAWGEKDVMFVDCPPGTGDVPLTVFQSLPIDGIVVVTTPQDLVSMIVKKAVKMAEMMNVPVIGIVENMSYFICDECEKKHYIFGESNVEDVAKEHGIPHVYKIPIDMKFRELVDAGDIESYEASWLDELSSLIDEI